MPLLVRSAWAPNDFPLHFSGDGQYIYASANPEHPDDANYRGSVLVRLDLHTNESVTVGTAGAGFVPSNENAMDWQCNFPVDFAVVGTKVYLPCAQVRSPTGDAFVQEFKCISFGLWRVERHSAHGGGGHTRKLHAEETHCRSYRPAWQLVGGVVDVAQRRLQHARMDGRAGR
jgi:hypothetical protein